MIMRMPENSHFCSWKIGRELCHFVRGHLIEQSSKIIYLDNLYSSSTVLQQLLIMQNI